MTTNLLLNSKTRSQLDRLVVQAPHAILLTGPLGIGKSSLAKLLAAQLLMVDYERLEHQPHFHVLRPATTALTIEQVRELEHLLSLKVPGSAAVRRVVLIDEAQKLTIEAQNALLKTLEEPPHDTVIILTSTSERALLPTVTSRLTSVRIQVPAQQEVRAYFEQTGAANEQLDRALAATGGLPGLMSALLLNEEHPIKLAIDEARSLLRKTTHERLAEVDRLSKDRALLDGLLFILQQMASSQLKKPGIPQADRWSHILQTVYAAEEALLANGQAKLVVTNLMLNLG